MCCSGGVLCVVCVWVCVWGCVLCVVMVASWALSGLQSTQLWDQLPSKGLGRTVLEGPGDRGTPLYLSPRMAYWLSSCKCCIEAPPVSSLPRFLCFTTSKVFSISLSLKHKHQVIQGAKAALLTVIMVAPQYNHSCITEPLDTLCPVKN